MTAIGDDRRAGIDGLSRSCCRCSTAIRCRRRSARRPGRTRARAQRRLDLIGLHPPKPVKDMPVPLAEAYFDLMPIHEKLRAPDFLAISNYLRVSLINIHDELIERLDVPAVVQSLLAGPLNTYG